jgi:hypothetical protein
MASTIAFNSTSNATRKPVAGSSLIRSATSRIDRATASILGLALTLAGGALQNEPSFLDGLGNAALDLVDDLRQRPNRRRM